MKKNLSKRLWLAFYVAILLISFLNAAVYLSMRSIWFFINQTINAIAGVELPGAHLVFILYIILFLYSLWLFIKCIKMQNVEFKRFRLIHIILPMILIAILSAIDAYIYSQLGDSYYIVAENLTAALPWLFLILVITFFIIFYPDLKISRMRAFKYGAACAAILAVLIFRSNPGAVKITSGPVIQVVDDSNLSVVWTTNRNSTGYVEYGVDENDLKRIVSSHNGIIDANTTVHKVILPVSRQGEFIYRVGSTKINHYFQNSVEYGNTVMSNFKRYKDYRLNKKITFYVVDDIHENTGLLKKLLNGKDYDFIVLNGDIINSADSRQVIENKILKPVSECTDGSKPFYLVRGNHETRGASARDLPDYLYLPDGNFYYTFQAGPVYAIVLDSAEDKPDSHEEYSGLADFERYLDNETKWLQTLSQSKAYKSAKFKIAFVHIPLNDFDDKDDSFYLKTCQQKWRELLNGMEIDAAFSGHAHSSYVIKKNNTEFTFDSFIGGGDSLDEKEFIAIKADVTEDSMKIYYINTSGEIVNEYEVF